MSKSAFVDWRAIEEKWISRWDEQKLFQADPDLSKNKYFVTVAYPYPNSPQHIGHGRTYTLADAHARYMRMKGYNVLLPMGFHYTGTPILGMSRRVSAGDKDLLDTFRNIYKLTDDVIATFVEPVKIASYFHNEIKQGMKEMGYSMDWRREFTTIDKIYSKFISWQFRTLQKKGLIVQGSHPVGWCPRDQNPVSQHDTMGDVEPDFTEYLLVKFVAHDGLIVPAATLRPETLFGVTNMWVNPEVEYVEAIVDGERWVVSRDAIHKLEYLNHVIEIVKPIMGSEMVGWQLTNPLNSAKVPMYPASFVESDNGTGIVMSVPAHAPYDYQALEDLEQNTTARQKYGISRVAKPVKIIESDGYTGIPAAEAIARVLPTEQDRLDKATRDLYSHEFYRGKMMQNTGNWANKSISIARDEVKGEIATLGLTSIMYELTNKPVRCRCGTECVVKLLNDQWFLNYGDKEWKALAHECVKNMDIVPQDIRQEFDYVVDWLRERACARKSGLGTRLPWDSDWIIESLSDSVLYMAYYTIAKYINDNTISLETETISDSFFDYVLFGKGDEKTVALESSVPEISAIRKEFQYFYPVDSRHSGRDLVPNHLSFFIFNHVAIFGRENWPRQIVVNGSVLMDGKKMSKSLGNIIPLRTAIREHGADTIRLAMLVSAEILQDADFSFDTAKAMKSKLGNIFDMTEKVKGAGRAVPEHVEDKWLATRLVRIAAQTAESMDRLRVREAIHQILYTLEQDLAWYDKRVRAKGRQDSPAVMAMLKEYVKSQVQMLAPFAPFSAEELWERLGNHTNGVTAAGWPSTDEKSIQNALAEESEFLLQNLVADIANIVKVTKIVPQKLVVFTCADWKNSAYRAVLENVAAGKANFGYMVKQLISNSQTAKIKSDPNLVKKMQDDILSTPVDARSRRLGLKQFDEASAIKDAVGLLTQEFNGAKVLIYSEDDGSKYDPKGKAKFARPFKPAVYME